MNEIAFLAVFSRFDAFLWVQSYKKIVLSKRKRRFIFGGIPIL